MTKMTKQTSDQTLDQTSNQTLDQTSDLEQEKTTAIRAARAAGEIIRAVYKTQYTVDYKKNDSPVTIADRDANQKIHTTLTQAFPDDGWLSEETVDSPTRLSRQRVWVVDPLDGTKEFIDKIPEFAVSIGLVEAGTPILGVIYNPALDELFWSIRGQGAWCVTPSLPEQRLQVTTTARLANATVLSSRSETKRGEWKPFTSLFQARPTGGMAHKLITVARGEADATFTLIPKNEWDLCAGALLLEEAGGKITNLRGKTVIFNQPSTLLQGLVASNMSLYPQLMSVITPRLTARHKAENRQ